MARPPKIDRKELKKPDEFMQVGGRLVDVIEANRKPLLVGIGIFLLAALGYAGYGWWHDAKLEKGWAAYYTATKQTGDAKWAELEKVQKEFSSVRPGFLAAVSIADYRFDNAKKEALKPADGVPEATRAVEWYRKALDFSGLEPTEIQLVLVNLGGALEMSGKIDEALAEYQKAADGAGVVSGLALLNLGRAHEMKKESDKAIAAYEKVVSGYGDSEYARAARNNLRRLKSPLFEDLRS